MASFNRGNGILSWKAACAVLWPCLVLLSRTLASARPDKCIRPGKSGARASRESATLEKPCHASPSRRNRDRGVTLSGVRNLLRISMTMPRFIFNERGCTA